MGDNIILTGFMGTGKTTVGRLLAGRLGLEFVDTDEIIEGRDGRAIADIFREDGEERFRQWEQQVATELGGQQGMVIATGGRLMLDPDNAAALGRTGPLFCLTAAPSEICRRVAADESKRPLLAGSNPEAQIRALLEQRRPFYARFRPIDTDGKTMESVVDQIEAIVRDGNRERLIVNHPGGSYEIVIGEDLLPEAIRLAGVSGPMAVVTDDQVGPLHAARITKRGPDRVMSLQVEDTYPVITILAGEQHKHLDTVRMIYDALLAAGIDRSGIILALGGGVVGDVAGFAAATFMRGVDLVLCPTSLLAMVDASIGGKTGVDLPQGKNLVGAFKQPRAVLADISTLATLPAAEFTSGLAEVAKHGLIADPVLWRRLMIEDWRIDPSQIAGDRLLRSALQSLVTQAIHVKRDVVEEDPYEQGWRAVLNLGHTFAHAVEQVSGYTVRHGDAVAIGLAAAADLSARLGECAPSLPGQVEETLKRLGLPVRIPATLEPPDLYAAMGSDKKKQAGRLRFVLIRDIGEVFIHADVPEKAVMATLVKMGNSERA
jgi:shikimate kinase / 3-dehydroquinate synthase